MKIKICLITLDKNNILSNELKSKDYICLVFKMLVLLLTNSKLYANHLMGSDITWKYLSYNRFEVTVKIYRDCRGVALGNSIRLNYECLNNGINVNNQITLKRTNWKEITPVCSAMPNLCGNMGNQPGQGRGVEEHIYSGIIDFNSGVLKYMRDLGCCEFIFYSTICCRNSAITTGSKDQDFYTDALINICNIENSNKPGYDNGPDFLNVPILNVCCNQTFYYNNGVIETDGDSLSFSLIPARKEREENVTYINSYSPNWPMTAYCTDFETFNCDCNSKAYPPTGFCFNQENGDLLFYPILCSEVGVMAIKVDQYRKNKEGTKWEHIGYTIRDIQLSIDICNNNPPVIEPINDIIICEGDKFCTEITAKDKETFNQFWKDTINLSWNEGLPGASFEVEDPFFEVKEDEIYAVRKVKVCWQTKIGDAKETPYFFTIIAKDKACPLNASSSVSFSVYVRKQLDSIDFYAHPLKGCNPLTVDFKLFESNPHSEKRNYIWDFGNNIASFEKNPENIKYNKAGLYTVKISVFNEICNTGIDKVNYIEVYPAPIAKFITNPTEYTSLSKTRVKMINQSQIEYGELNYFWDFGTGNPNDISEEVNPEFHFHSTENIMKIYRIHLYAISEKECIDSTHQYLTVKPSVFVFVPNAFSPDNFGPDINNRFNVYTNGINDFHIKIYNRWGEQLFESFNPNYSWDGTYNGNNCTQDIYFYKLWVRGFDEKNYNFSGTINLIR